MDATREAAEFIAANAREADVAELWASGRVTPLACMEHGLESALFVRVGLVDGEPACMFGVTPASLLGGVGCPWMVATPAVERAARTLALLSVPVVEQMQAIFPMLVNFVDNRNVKAIRWLRWLGFQFDQPPQLGADGVTLFRPFWRKRHV